MVLGHRLTKETGWFLRGVSIWGLSLRSLAWIIVRSVSAKRGRPVLTPIWNHTRQSDAPVPDGLWLADRPRGRHRRQVRGFLVVEGGRARYLECDLLHTCCWCVALEIAVNLLERLNELNRHFEM